MTISVVFDPPNRGSDTGTAFSNKTDDTLSKLNLWGGEANATKDEINAAQAQYVASIANIVAGATGTPVATSTTSNTVGTGSKTFAIQTGKPFQVGQRMSVAYTTTPTTVMYGVCTASNAITGSVTVLVDSFSGTGTFTAWTIAVSGGPGSTGATGPISASALSYTFSTTTTDADPGNGVLRFNNATQASATSIFIDLQDTTAAVITTFLDSIGTRSSAVKAHVYIRSQTVPASVIVFRIDSVTTATGYRKLVGAVVANSATSPFANTESLQISFVVAGDTGTDNAITAVAALDLNLANGARYFTKTINANSTFTFSNVPSGAVGWVLQLTHTSGTITLPASVRYPDNAPPTLTAGTTHYFYFSTTNSGTLVLATIVPNVPST